MAMDVPRGKEVARRKLIRRIIYIVILVAAIPLITWGLSRLKPAAPSVDGGTVWRDTVKRGPMVRDVRGLGTLVPETIRLIPAVTDGQVQTRYLLPGTPVKANTVIFDLINPQLQQETLDAEYQLKGAQASYEQTKAQLQNQLMDKRTLAASVSSQYRTAEMVRQTKEELGANGLAPQLDVKTAQVQAEELAKENDLAQKEVETFNDSIASQLAVQEATVNQKRAMYELKKSQMDQL